jgi:hypothetical protein
MSPFAANAVKTFSIEDRLRPEYLNESLERMLNSAGVSEPTADDKEDAIAPMSASCAQSI